MITIKGTVEEIDYMIDCMAGNCAGCKAWEVCEAESKKCNNCTSGKECGECIKEEKSCGEMIRESINIIIVEE